MNPETDTLINRLIAAQPAEGAFKAVCSHEAAKALGHDLTPHQLSGDAVMITVSAGGERKIEPVDAADLP